MRLKYAVIIISFFISGLSFSQHSLNDYKYVIVEKQFHFQNEPNQYHLNRIVKFGFQDVGFQVLMEDQPIPEDLRSDFCLALQSEVVTLGTFKTRVQIHLRDCEGRIVYSTQEGVTKEKEHDKSYKVAIERAFESFHNVIYKYEPKEDKEEKEAVTTAQAEVKPKDVEIKPSERVEVKTDSDELSKTEMVEPVAEVVTAKEVSGSKPLKENEQFVARKIENGYELLQSSEIIMVMLESGINNVYLVLDQNAVIYQEDGKWLYNDRSDKNNKPIVLDIKF